MPVTTKPVTLKAYGHVKGGVFYLADKRTFDRAIRALPDGPHVLTILPEADARTIEANGHYFGTVLREIAAQRNANEGLEPSITIEALHDHYKAKFNGGQSTTRLTPKQFSVYVERVMADAAQEHGVEFPEPAPLLVGA